MGTKEKFLELVSKEETPTLNNVKNRIKNRAMLRESQKIALKVLLKLDELGWTQKDLAQRLEVSPQQVHKIVSGKENLTIETQIKLQNVLDIPVLASYYENKMNVLEEWVVTMEKRIENIAFQKDFFTENYQTQKTIRTEYKNYSEYIQLAV